MTGTEMERATKRFVEQQAEAIATGRKNVEEVRRRTRAVQEKLLSERNVRLAEVTNSMNRTLAKIRAQQRAVATNIRGEAISRDVHVRVSRGMESLEGLVRLLRESAVSEEKLLEALHDPVVSGTLFDRERRASVSGLIQSVQRQLVQQYEFINVAAHELRTPITPILMNAELLKEKMNGDSKELDTIMRNAQRLQRLSENILSASKIDSNSLHFIFEEFDMNALVGQVMHDLEYSMKGKDTRIIFVPVADELMVRGDRDRVSQVVGNLIENALKFASRTVIVSTHSSSREAALVVADDGPGIDPKIRPVLFTKFATNSSKGTGLGLYICKKIAEAHGGRLEATDSMALEPGGAEFTFTLPRSAGAPVRPAD